jgi:hypothetical protein
VRCVARLADGLKAEYGDGLREIDVNGVRMAWYAAARGITANNAAAQLHPDPGMFGMNAEGASMTKLPGADDWPDQSLDLSFHRALARKTERYVDGSAPRLAGR